MKNLTTILLVVWTLIMAWLLLAPSSPEVTRYFFQGEDKLAHFLLFMVWCFLMTLRGLYEKADKRSLLIIVVMISLVIAATTEVLQGFIPYRSRDFVDFVADMIGAGIGITLAFFFKRVIA